MTRATGPAGARTPSTGPTYEMFGVRITGASATQIIALLDASLARRRKFRLLYANAHVLNQVAAEPALADLFRDADITICDGYGSALGIRILHGGRPSRQTPPDWIEPLADLCVRRRAGLFLLGSTDTAATGTAAALTGRHPGLRIAGIRDGFFDKARDSAGNRAVVDAINASGADVLLVGLGLPLQERWIAENADHLDCTIVIAVGAMFDFLSGEVGRGPKLLTDNGFEWLTRLASEPKRLWRRYLVGLPVFFVRVLAAKFRSAFR